MKTLPGLMVTSLLLALCFLGTPTVLNAHGGDTSLIHTCFKNATGNLRIIAASDTCKANETALDWNLAGATGPQGPAGPQGPSGLFKFVGFSTGTINGGQGMLQMHALCQVDYGSTARMSTSKEFWLSPNATAPTTAPAWLHPSDPTNHDFSSPNASCTGWTNGTSDQNGLVVDTAGKPGLSRCDFQRPVACAAP